MRYISPTLPSHPHILRHGMDEPVFDSRQARDLSLLEDARTGFGAQPTSYSMPIVCSFLVGVKRPGREANALWVDKFRDPICYCT